MTILDAVIVGAGMAGLMAARTLTDAGWRVAVLDKGRSVGGRMATRWLDGRANLADHGAQFFTVRSVTFEHWVQQWQAAQVVKVWAHGWSNNDDTHPRYAAPAGLNALARHVAHGLPVQVNTTVQAVQVEGNGWRVLADDGTAWHARRLLLTAPVPQSLALLQAGGVPVEPPQHAELNAVTYDPCLCALFRLEHPSRLTAPGALQHPTAHVGWLADNHLKGLSAAPLFTVHATPDYSRTHYAAAEATVLADLWAEVQPWANDPAPLTQQLKRWRYAQVQNPHPQRYVRLASLPPVFLAGDGFGEPRLEGAALSGLAAATALLGT